MAAGGLRTGQASEVHPSPEQAAALFSAGLIFVEDLPSIAAQWLAVGHDSESLRLLAGAENDDLDDIRSWWAQALTDLAVPAASVAEKWRHVWGYELAAWQAGLRTSREVLSDVIEYVRADDYAAYDSAPEAISSWMLWDEMTSDYEPKRPDEEVWVDVDAYLRSCL